MVIMINLMLKRFINYSIIFNEFDLKDIKVLTGDTCQTISKINVLDFVIQIM